VARKAATVVRAVAKAVVKAAAVAGKAAVAVAKVAYKVSGVQSIVSCVTDPALSSCLQAALTVALVVGTAGSGEIADIAAEGALDAAEDAGTTAAEDTAEQAAEKTGQDEAESCSLGGESFTAGTKVLLANGKAVPISQLKVGDKVLATNTKTGETRAEPVAAVLVHHDTDRYDLAVRTRHGTAVIDTTRNHLFWDVTKDRWVKAGALKYGEHLRTSGAGRSGWDRGRGARSRPPRWLDVGPHHPR
jgi:hypothetical protein